MTGSDKQTIDEALAVVRSPQPGSTLVAHGFVKPENDDGASDDAGASGETPVDPLWGEVLDDEVRELDRPLTRAELDALLVEFDQAKAREQGAEAEAKHYRARHKAAKEALAEVEERLQNRTTTDAVRCPVRLRDGVLVVLHPETGEVLETREPSDNDHQLSLPNHEATDAADGIDRVQIRARLLEHESALSISRGVHAVPPQSEIDSWSTGVCRATVDWLDSIDRGESEGDVLMPLPVWVTGARGSEQTAHQQAEIPEEQVELVWRRVCDGSLDAIPFGRVRLDLATLVAEMKRQQVTKGTSQHLTAVLRMVGDAGGLPQFNQAVADAEGARLRLIYFIAKAKPSAEGMDEADVRSAVVAEVGRMLNA